jgi:hypothetical protein
VLLTQLEDKLKLSRAIRLEVLIAPGADYHEPARALRCRWLQLMMFRVPGGLVIS